ncbi:MAG: GNAT family N-acetyltransferase [Gemmatimonadota bacterium]|nr:GNAT family N-acetyltransferase [Gemmatimonadota bacterium]
MSDDARFVARGPMLVRRVTLEGQKVALRPMTAGDVSDLFRAARFPEIWEHTATAAIETEGDMTAYVATALAEESRGESLPLVLIDPVTRQVVGASRFANISPADRRLAIGWSWLRPDRHGTGMNGEAKALMLQQAFDGWGALRVEIRADVLNGRSRSAIERIGGTYEGTLRQHMIVRGRVRDTAYYSVIDLDWRDPAHRAYANALRYGITPGAAPAAATRL